MTQKFILFCINFIPHSAFYPYSVPFRVLTPIPFRVLFPFRSAIPFRVLSPFRSAFSFRLSVPRFISIPFRSAFPFRSTIPSFWFRVLSQPQIGVNNAIVFQEFNVTLTGEQKDSIRKTNAVGQLHVSHPLSHLGMCVLIDKYLL